MHVYLSSALAHITRWILQLAVSATYTPVTTDTAGNTMFVINDA